MRNSLPLTSDGKCHMFCSRKRKQSRVCKIGVHYDLQNFSILLLTVNRNTCDPWIFQLVIVVGSCQNVNETYDFLKFIVFSMFTS